MPNRECVIKFVYLNLKFDYQFILLLRAVNLANFFWLRCHSESVVEDQLCRE